MLLTKCYYVVYHVADFTADNEFICHQDAYRDHNNALLVAKDLAKCLDVADNVFVIDGLTGEVLNTILKDAPQEDKAEEDDVPADDTPPSVNTYRDKDGNTWFRIGDGRWIFDCANRHCADCPYYDEECGCIVREPLYDDETGGVWRLTEASEWDYDCTGLMCSDCVYSDDEQLCLVHNPLTEEERDIQIESAKERMKK